MSFLEALTIVGVSTAILGVFLTIYGVMNNKTIKHETRLTRETLTEALQEEGRLTREVVAEESRLTREALEKESRLTREMIKDTTKYLGDLIVAERARKGE